MIPASVARLLRDRKVDACAIDERPDARGISDAQVIALAKREGRVVVTFNSVDFLAEERMLIAAGESHNGIVLVNTNRFSNSRTGVPKLVDALAGLAESGRSLRGYVSWLR